MFEFADTITEDSAQACCDCAPAETSAPDALGMPDPGAAFGRSEDEFWQQQSLNGYCGPVSAAILLKEFGVDVTEEEIVAFTQANGLFADPNDVTKGMYIHDLERLMDAYGVESHQEVGSIATLEQHLAENRGIILFVDSSEIGSGTSDDAVDGGLEDHFLVITEIDEENGTVRLNDPGRPDGMGYTLTIAQLEEAWADSGNQMIVTDSSPAVQDPTAPPVAAPATEPVDGWTVLPASVPSDSLVPCCEPVQSIQQHPADPTAVIPSGQPGGPSETLESPLSVEQLHELVASYGRWEI